MTRQNAVYFKQNNKPVPQDLETLDTSVMHIDRLKPFNLLGVIIDEKFNWHEPSENVCNALLQFHAIFNHTRY